jgi:hypothetical protein
MAVNCNIWDNLFSQMDSPGYTIPDDFKVFFFNNIDNKKKLVFSISASSSINKIKLSLYSDQNTSYVSEINEEEKTKTDKKLKFLGNNDESKIKETNNTLINLKNDTTAKSFFDIYVDFNEGIVTSDMPDYNCTFKNVSMLKFITTKFVLVSYDVLTYYLNKDGFHNFIFTNPVSTKKDLNVISDPVQWINDFISDLDLASLIVFKVDKTTNYLKNVELKYNSTNLMNLEADVHIYIQPNPNDFIFNKKCTEDKSNTTLSESILSSINKKN